MIYIVLLAPTLALRAGLRAMLGGDPELEVIAEAANLADLGALPPATDLLVAVAEAVSQQGLAPLLAGTESEPPPALLLLADEPQAAGEFVGLPLRAWGLLPLEASEEELVAAARALHEGLLAGAPALMEPLLETRLALGGGAEPPVEELTPRELEVLQLLAQGLANKQIALELEISEHTVKFHVSSVYQKLGATNRTEAVRLGVRLGLIVL